RCEASSFRPLPTLSASSTCLAVSGETHLLTTDNPNGSTTSLGDPSNPYNASPPAISSGSVEIHVPVSASKQRNRVHGNRSAGDPWFVVTPSGRRGIVAQTAAVSLRRRRLMPASSSSARARRVETAGAFGRVPRHPPGSHTG